MKKKPLQKMKGRDAAQAKHQQTTSRPTAASGEHPPRTQNREGTTPSAPKSIQDIARLFIGASSVGEALENTERHTTQLKNAKSLTKRPREGAENDAFGNRSQAKRSMGSAIASSSSSTTNTIITLKGKAHKQTKRTENHENGDDEEDAELSKAVQAQTLHFLQHLNSKSSKAFWGLRDVAQGKRSAAAAAAAATASSPSGKKTAKRGTKGAKKAVHDEEEMWRVGGPYIPGDEDSYTSENEPERGCSDRSESRDSTSSSEPSWITDSSEEGEVSSNGDTDSAQVATGTTSRRSMPRPPKQGGGGGGHLFQGGSDGVWDDD
ncbi:hypothetical protein JKF63_00693 [Porcisia hertigi]|uniref:Uncharacterized protein n=1 Tax=Porcisia hertigi TaxID=2761500 RepID=A0A836IA15_9TRYP|nr:hypothetical protein JKF63_00693 [Porcisia hertigi]